VLGNGAGFWCDDGDVPRCAAQAARAESILEPLLPPGNQGRVQLIDNRAKLAGLRGDLASAYALRQQAVALSSANGVRTAERSGGLANLAEAALALGRTQEAAEHAAQAETIARAGLSGFPSSLYLARALLAQSRVRAAQGDAEGARAKATEALAQAQSSAGDKAPVALEAAALLQRLAR
jgi:tetratricopeptide (TPR) repeat protein